MKTPALFALLVLLPFTAHAELYKCVENGHTTFQDFPCSNGDSETVDTIEVMNTPLGGTFTSRLNMNLREEKHWSYGARTAAVKALGVVPTGSAV